MNEARSKAQGQVQAAKKDIEADRVAAEAGLQKEASALAAGNRPARAAAGGGGTPVRNQGLMISASKILYAAVFTGLIVSVAGFVQVRAEDQSHSPAQQQVSKDTSQNSGGPGRQLAHESREAAGEEKDETAEFKQSASVRLVSRITGLDLQKSYWLSVITNFVVIAVVLVWAGRKYMPGLFRDRTAAIQKAMQEAQKASEEARRKLADIESRLMKLDVEIGMMRDAAEKEARGRGSPHPCRSAEKTQGRLWRRRSRKLQRRPKPRGAF